MVVAYWRFPGAFYGKIVEEIREGEHEGRFSAWSQTGAVAAVTANAGRFHLERSLDNHRSRLRHPRMRQPRPAPIYVHNKAALTRMPGRLSRFQPRT